MAKLASILQYLHEHHPGCRVIGAASTDSAPEVRRISRDDEAEPGDLAWLSLKKAQAEPDRVHRFEGTLLICPELMEPTPRPGSWYVLCPNPKLAVIGAIQTFFAEAAANGLPGHGDPPIHPSALIGDGVRLGFGAVVGSGVEIADGVVVGPHTVLARCCVGAGTSIGASCVIGLPGFGMDKDASGRYLRFPHVGGVRIGADVEIGSNVCIDRGSIGDTVICDGARIDNLVHVAHNVVIGENAVVIANAMLGGSARVERDSWIAPSASIMNQASVGAGAVVGLGAVVLRDVAADTVVAGNPARELERKGGE